MDTHAYASTLDVLVNLPHGGEETAALQAATFLCKRLDARLDALCIVPPMTGNVSVPEITTQQLDEIQLRRQQAEHNGTWYDGLLRQHTLEGRWQVTQGDPVQTLCHVTAGYDLLVLERDDRRGEAPLGFGTVSRAIFGCRAPVLVVPAKTRAVQPGRRILLAWNGSRESLLAARDALPILRHAESVTVLEGTAEQPWVSHELPALQLTDWLRRRGITANVRAFDPGNDAGAAILRAAHDTEADLIVMGAWGRSRVSEMLLGGATRHLFAESDVPMLVAH
ncbi:universal stress protein [Oleiagrimonas sp. C23AA]|uniref:universal stress protein n=1 Tax=Oleiagrimonas sp. C23AA TaxID=2719047 RepID=UPI00141FFAE3|nr:universal stress protein [Oleiagrimonas sp. C23AA]NII09749.1 universal stress protein [Oleiagrimonas sp. C23AA]